MTAATFCDALVRVGLSHSQTRTILGVDIRMVRDWASGRKLIPNRIAAWLVWRVVSVRGPLFNMDITPGAGATYFYTIAWNRAVGAPSSGDARHER